MSEKSTQKILSFIPGFLTWFMLLSPLILGFFIPSVVVFILTFLTIYWVYRSINGILGLIYGYSRYKKESKVNWWKKVKNLDFKKLPNPETLPKSLEELKHFIIIPIYAEPYEVLKENFKSIKNSSVPSSSIVLVYAVEEKHHKRVLKDIKDIQKKFDSKKEISVLSYIHPQNIEGEVQGVAGPNRDWAARHAIADLRKQGEDFNNYIFHTFDSDARIHKHYLARITYEYLTTNKRKNYFYETAVHIFDNNTYDVPLINRVAADAITIALLATWSTLNWPTTTVQMDTFSCYSCALTTAIKADFWDPSLGIDDTIFYWRAFKAMDGDFEGKPFFVPIHLDATQGNSYINSHVSLYKQQLRWGWGIIAFPLSVVLLKKAQRATLFDKISHFWNTIEHFVLLRTLAFLHTFGFILLTFINQNIRQANYAYAVPKLNSILLTITMLGTLPVFYIRLRIKKPMPKEWSLYKKVGIVLLEIPALYINLLTFSFVPWLEAETKMMLGKRYKSLYYTPKFR